MTNGDDRLNLLEDLIGKACAAGADAADALFAEGISLSFACRLGEPEQLERSEGADLGLRVFKGHRQAIVSSSDVSPGALDELVERAVAMAASVPEDPFCGIADPDQIMAASAVDAVDLDMTEPGEPAADILKQRALESEDAARAVSGITNSEGAEASWSHSTLALAASNGFRGARQTTRSGMSVSVLAGEGTAMERDYDFSSTVFSSDLPDPADLGRRAAEQAVARLNPRKVASAQVPVIYAPRISGSILGHLSSAINGAAVARGTSFLKDCMGEQVFSDAITIVDDPLRQRGLRSKAFDGEGLPTSRKNIIEKGTLKTWILNLRSARQLGIEPSGHASRGTSSPPGSGVTNFYLEPGTISPEEMMAEMGEGLLITEMIGHGINYVTGDYSRGATGFWIENGEVAYPVSEVTIAGNLREMFANVTAADDLQFRYGTDAPSLRVDGMTIAGK